MVQRDPFSVLARMDREFDDLVRRGWGAARAGGAAGGATTAGFVPAVELVRDGEDVVVRVELPGIDVERDVAIEVERGRLVISGERHDGWSDAAQQHGAQQDGARQDGARQDDGQRQLLVRELRYGRFRREFALPNGISPEQVSATYDAGLLDVRVRGVVAPEPRPVRVPITAASREPADDQPRVLEHEQEPAQG